MFDMYWYEQRQESYRRSLHSEQSYQFNNATSDDNEISGPKPNEETEKTASFEENNEKFKEKNEKVDKSKGEDAKQAKQDFEKFKHRYENMV